MKRVNKEAMGTEGDAHARPSRLPPTYPVMEQIVGCRSWIMEEKKLKVKIKGIRFEKEAKGTGEIMGK